MLGQPSAMEMFAREEYMVGPTAELTVGQLYTVVLQTELTVGQPSAVELRTELTVGQPSVVELLLSTDVDSGRGDDAGEGGREDNMWSGGCP